MGRCKGNVKGKTLRGYQRLSSPALTAVSPSALESIKMSEESQQPECVYEKCATPDCLNIGTIRRGSVHFCKQECLKAFVNSNPYEQSCDVHVKVT